MTGLRGKCELRLNRPALRPEPFYDLQKALEQLIE
jgi:hypothetical protein